MAPSLPRSGARRDAANVTPEAAPDTLPPMAPLVLRAALAALVGLGAARPAEPAAAPAAARTAAPATDLARTIDAILAAGALAKATIGVVVVDVATGAVLYEKGADLPVNPASNVKLVTTASALALLGPEHRYVTRLAVGKGTRKDGAIVGDIFLRGGGDPSLVTADLYELASDLKALGITRIDGGVVVDATAFDRDELPPGFDQKDEFAYYRTPGGAASVNFNTFVVHVRPGNAVGEAAVMAVDPPAPSLVVRSEVATVAGSRNRVTVTPEVGADGKRTLVMGGTIGEGAGPASYRYPIEDPSTYAGEVLRLVLGQRGIKVAKGVRIAATPKDAEVVATHRSEPLSVLIRGVNKLSNNFMAEQILKSLDPASPATFAGAIARVRGHLEGLGLATEGLSVTNGSGLYDTNRITARQLTQLLVRVHADFRIAADFLASLPIMGADGTLRDRLTDGAAARYVRAKTGTLNQASSLSGYAGTIGKPPLAFAILIGDIDRSKLRAARDAQNKIAEALVQEAAARP